jgi:hypothetical protein
MTTTDITAALAAAKTSAVMIIEELTGPQWGGFDPDALRKAEAAMAKYDRSGSAIDSAAAYKLAGEALATNFDLAMEIINKRIAARAAKAPLASAAACALIGQD